MPYRCLPILAACLALAACGLKGDLYLPPEPAPAPAPAATTAAGTDAEAADAPAAPDDPATIKEDARRQLPATPDRSKAE